MGEWSTGTTGPFGDCLVFLSVCLYVWDDHQVMVIHSSVMSCYYLSTPISVSQEHKYVSSHVDILEHGPFHPRFVERCVIESHVMLSFMSFS